MRRIAFALSSCTKAQTERLNANDNAPFIPISIPALYPMRINRDLSSYTSLSSLTRLERVKTPGCAEARRKRDKRIPFLRCNTLSTLNLRIAVSSGSDLAPSTELNRNFIDETAKSLRTTLTTENTIVKKKLSRDQLSKHIKHLRNKFSSVSEENHSSMRSNSNSDTDLIQSFAINSKKEKNHNETKTSIMASLLIDSIRSMPLENVGTDNLISIVSSDEQLTTTNNDEVSEAYCGENPRENEEIKDEREQQDNTSIEETEISSFYDDNSSGDESSNDTTSYNILDDSRYSLDDSRTADSSSLQERIPITIRSSAESCTDSTLQVDSDVAMSCQLSSNPDLANVENIELRNMIPVITVDIHKSVDSYMSNNENSNITTSAETEIFVSKAISSSDERETDDVKCKIDISENFKSEKIDNSLYEACRDVHLMTKHEGDLCRSHPNGQPVQLESLSPAEPEDYISTDREGNNMIDLPRTTTRHISVSKEELLARAIAERRRCMRDLIKLIDTRMMISTHTHHSKRAASLKSKKKKREKKMHKKITNTSENSLEKIPSRDASTRRHATSHRRRRKEDVLFRVSRVHSIPNYLSLEQQPNISISHTISRSCDSSLINLTDYRVTRVSRGSKRSALLSPTIPTFDDSSEILRQLPKSSHSKSVDGGTRPSTIYNLKKASCHIDHTKPTNTANITHNSCVSRPSPDLRQQDEASISPSYPLPAVSSMTVKMSQSPATRTLANVPLHRRSSDSDLSVTPKGEKESDIPITCWYYKIRLVNYF